MTTRTRQRTKAQEQPSRSEAGGPRGARHLPVMPRPLSDDEGLAEGTNRDEPRDARAPRAGPNRRARGLLVLACIVITLLFPALADACAPAAAPTDEGIRLLGIKGVERVKMEVAYLSEDGTAGRPGVTRYRVISTPVPGDGHVTDGLPPAAKLVSAEVIAASGPACR